MPYGNSSDAINQIISIVLEADPAAAQHLRAELQQLEAQMKAIALSGVAAGKSTAEVGAEVAALTQKAALARQMLTGMEGGLSNTGSAASHASRGVLELSRGIEDITTGGPIGILNNIPGMFEGIGRAAGMTVPQVNVAVAGVTAFSTGVYILWRNWNDFQKPLGNGKLENETAEMDRLHKSTTRTADEQARLNHFKEKHQQMQAAAGVKAPMQTEHEKTYEAGVATAGGSDTVLGEIAASLLGGGEDGVAKHTGEGSYQDYI
jgi:hypothetical protein